MRFGRGPRPRPRAMLCNACESGREPLSVLGGFVLLAAFGIGEDLIGDEAGVLPDRRLDAHGDVRVLLEEELLVHPSAGDEEDGAL